MERTWTYLSAMWSALNMAAEGKEGTDGALSTGGRDSACARNVVLHACAALDALARALSADAQALNHVLMVRADLMSFCEACINVFGYFESDLKLSSPA